MNLARINELIKASPAIQIQSNISLLQRRAWNVLLANAYNELPNKEIHSISVGELAAKLGFKDKHSNQHYLKAALRALRSCEVEWNMLAKDKEEWGRCGFVSRGAYRGRHLLLSVPAHIAPETLQSSYLHQAEPTSPKTGSRADMPSFYGKSVSTILIRIGDQGETTFISLETFRELLGIESDEYPAFSIFNRAVIKPAINEINKETDYHIEVEQKRLKRRVSELKFRITKVKQIPIQESLFPDIENLPPVAIELVQAAIDRNIALKIADQEWGFVNPEKLPPPGAYSDFLAFVAEKIEISLHATDIKNRAGFIIEAIRENYQDPEVQKVRELRAEKTKQKKLEDLETEFEVKRDNILRQAVHAQPELVELAAERTQSYMIRARLLRHESAIAAYQKGGMVKAEIDGILAEEFCQDVLTPVHAAYEDEKSRILGEVG